MWPKTKREDKDNSKKRVYSSALVIKAEKRLAEKRLACTTLQREKQVYLRTRAK
jgi:hypothetical protein